MNIKLIIAIVTILGAICGALWTHSKKEQKVEEAVQKWAPIVFDAVNDMVERDRDKYPNRNKSTLFVDRLTQILESKGIKVTPEIITQARAIADSLHYQDRELKKNQGEKSCGRPCL